jgi:hypothetical protein
MADPPRSFRPKRVANGGPWPVEFSSFRRVRSSSLARSIERLRLRHLTFILRRRADPPNDLTGPPNDHDP